MTTIVPIHLIAHHCRNNVTFPVSFHGPEAEARAIAYIEARTSTHAIEESENHPIPRDALDLLDTLYPTCSHGLSLRLCAGPGHYGPDPDSY